MLTSNSEYEILPHFSLTMNYSCKGQDLPNVNVCMDVQYIHQITLYTLEIVLLIITFICEYVNEPDRTRSSTYIYQY